MKIKHILPCLIFTMSLLWSTVAFSWEDFKLPYIIQESAPGVTDDSFTVPYLWVDIANDKEYILIDNTPGAAIWQVLYTAGSFPGNLVPDTDNTYDIGSSSYEWRDLYIDGTANLDYVDIDGPVSIQPSADSVTAVQILDADGGTPVASFDTVNERLGIGTAAPGEKFEVIGGHAKIQNTLNTNLIISTGAVDYDAALYFKENDSFKAFVKHDASNDALAISDGASTETITVKSSSVGIGTTTPASKLDIEGGNLDLDATVSSTTGVITKGGTRFIHNYDPPNNGTVDPVGYNTFVGLEAGNFTMGSTATSTDKASYNTFVGYQVGKTNTIGNGNTFNGYRAGFSNTTGGSNTFNGMQAGYANTTGYQNTFNGYTAGFSNTAGNNNTFNGYTAGYANTTGHSNTFNGMQAGRFIANGTDPNQTTNTSVFIGNDTKASADGVSNEIVIGYNATGNGSNTVTLGNDSITKSILRGNVGIGQTTFGTSAAKTLAQGNGTAPTTSPADAYQVWSADHNAVAGKARMHQRTEDGLAGPVAMLSEVTESVNTKMPSQAVEMTAASSGSTGITVADNDNIDFGTVDFTLVWRGSLPDWTPSAGTYLLQHGTYSVGSVGTVMIVDGTTGYIRVAFSNSGATVGCVGSVATNFIDGTVHDIVAVVSDTQSNVSTSLYIDGKLLWTALGGSAIDSRIYSAGLYISGSSSTRTASRTEAAYTFNRALTAAEVADLYKNGVSYADKWGSQTAINDYTFDSGVAGWEVASADETSTWTHDTDHGVLAVTSAGTNANRPYVMAQNLTIDPVLGKKYRVSFDYTVNSGTCILSLLHFDNTVSAAIHETLTGSGTFIYEVGPYTATDDDLCFYLNGTNEFNVSIDNIQITPIGATLALEPENIQTDKWYDASTNSLDASYPTAGWNLVRPADDVFKNIYMGGGQFTVKTNVADTAYGTSALTSDYIVAFTSLTAARAAVISTEDEDSGTATQPRIMIFKDESGSAGTYNITISLESGGTIDGNATKTINQPYGFVKLYLNGTNGFTMGGN